MQYNLANKQARQFLLYKHGLLGDYQFKKKDGIIQFTKQVGCIQYDPIDVCGKSPELVLLSRIQNFHKQQLNDLLYKDRVLIDYFDKNLSFFLTEDWPFFQRERNKYKKSDWNVKEIDLIKPKILEKIQELGFVSSTDLNMNDKVDWYWSKTKLSRAALERMYFTGELAIHHKKRTIKYYDLIENCIPSSIINTPEPFPNDQDHITFRVLRRIQAVGLLWNKASDAWLGMNLKSNERNIAFQTLISQDKIVEVKVDNIKESLYCIKDDIQLIEYILTNPKLKKRCEFIAPLDNMMWDRKLIKALFDFDYTWEIYTPQVKRQYGYYTLPILYGEQFIGRIEPVFSTKKQELSINQIWYEPNIKETKEIQKAIQNTIKKLEDFNKQKVDIS